MSSPAPIALFTYARPSHTRRVREGIRATGTPLLYVFSDGPRSEADAPRVEETRQIIQDVDWAEVKFFPREQNAGLARSIIEGVSRVLQDHDRVMVLEDDCVPEKDYYRVMGQLLQEFEAEPRVMSLSGYGFPMKIPPNYPYTHFTSYRGSTWGWATWKDRWQQYEPDTKALLQKLKSDELITEKLGPDAAGFIRAQVERGLDIWSPGWLLLPLFTDQVTLWPTRSLVSNIGFDESGMNCAPTRAKKWYDIENTRWITGTDPRVPDNLDPDPRIQAEFFRYLAPPSLLRVRLKKILRKYLFPGGN